MNSRSDIPTDEELERSFTQWEREHPQGAQEGHMNAAEFLEFQKRFNPSAVVEAAWEEMQ